MSLTSYGIKHPAVITIITLGLVFFGILAFNTLNREFVPPMSIPEITVVSLWPGAGPADVERDVTEVLEDQFATLSGLKEIRSSSAEGYSLIQMEFREDQHPRDRLPEVRARIRRAREDLPSDLAYEPEASVYGVENLTVMSFTVSGAVSPDQLSRYVDKVVVPELYLVEGVSQVQKIGGREKELVIRLSPEALGDTGTGPLQIYQALKAQNLSLPAGTVTGGTGEWPLRITGEFKDIEHIENINAGFIDGHFLKIKDVASVTLEYLQPEEYVRSQGKDLMVLEIQKRKEGNILDMSRDIRRRLQVLQASGEYEFTILGDDRDLVRYSLRAVFTSALTGLFMAVAVIWLFLRDWRATAAVAVSLPVSLLAAFAGMRLAGQTINILTLSGITVSLGMVVDASLVVLENIYQKTRPGEDLREAAERGAREVSSAVLASTITSVCVFVPMMFLTGIIGNIMKDLSLTLVFCLGASLLSAIFLVPGLVIRILGKRKTSLKKKPSSPPVVLRFLEKNYVQGLTWSLKLPWTVVAAAVLVLGTSVLASDALGLSFVPSADGGDFFLYMETPPGSTLDETAEKTAQAEKLIREEVPEILSLVFFIGRENENSAEARRRDAAYGKVVLTRREKRDRGIQEIIQAVREKINTSLPDVSLVALNGGFDRLVAMSAGGSGFQVGLTGENLEDLQTAGDRVMAWMEESPQVYKTERDIQFNRQELSFVLDGDSLGDLGLTAEETARSVRIFFEGADAGEYRPGGGLTRNIRLLSDLEGQTPDLGVLNRVKIPAPGGEAVPLDALGTVDTTPGISEIRRRNRVRTLNVTGYTLSENTRELSSRLRNQLKQEGALPPGVEWQFQGIFGLISESVYKLFTVFLIAVFLVYAVMVIQFEKFIQPLIIMSSVPFCFIGVVAGLAVFGSDFSIISFLGIVALGGIVVNNAIVLVDKINDLHHKQGRELLEAVIAGCQSRLRPILMTSMTTFLGILPLALSQGTGTQVYAPLGQAILGGLFSSTLITLFLVPVLYYLSEKNKAPQKQKVTQG